MEKEEGRTYYHKKNKKSKIASSQRRTPKQFP
jgi:hypothetical protein